MPRAKGSRVPLKICPECGSIVTRGKSVRLDDGNVARMCRCAKCRRGFFVFCDETGKIKKYVGPARRVTSALNTKT